MGTWHTTVRENASNNREYLPEWRSTTICTWFPVYRVVSKCSPIDCTCRDCTVRQIQHTEGNCSQACLVSLPLGGGGRTIYTCSIYICVFLWSCVRTALRQILATCLHQILREARQICISTSGFWWTSFRLNTGFRVARAFRCRSSWKPENASAAA